MSQRRSRSAPATSSFGARYYRGEARSGSKVRVWGGYALVVLVTTALIAGWMWARVETVSVQGGDPSVRDAVQERVRRHYTFLWHPYTHPPEQVIGLPGSVAGVEVSTDWTNRRLVVAVEMRQPVIIWKTGEKRLLVDARGFVMGRSSGDRPELPVVHDASDLPAGEGEQVTPERFITFVQTVADSELPIERLRVIDTTSELYADLERGYSVRFDTTSSAQTQLDNVARVQETARRNNDTITEYIDVRLEYKAYYR